MMKSNKAYKFRLYPNKKQAKQLDNNLGSCRFVFNYFLTLSKETYEKEKRCLRYKDYAKKLVQLKNEKTFLQEVDSISLQQSLRHLEMAFLNFFKNPSNGYPQYKRKIFHNDTYSTINVNNNIKIVDNRHIKIPKIGIVKCIVHRNINDDYKLKSATINKTPSGKYFISILFEYEKNIETYTLDYNKAIGLDYSNQEMFICSDKLQFDKEFIKIYRKNEERLHFLQQTLSRRKKANHKQNEESSKRYEKQRIKVAKYHEYLKNKRLDYYNKLTNEIANHYDAVVIEDLNMQDMTIEYKRSSKVIYDNAWGLFTKLLKYKLEEKSKKLIKANKYFASSKICNCCNYKNEALTIEVRNWICPNCGARHNRDINASINLKKEGLRLLNKH